VQFVRKNKGLSVGLGMLFSICFYIPIIGGVIASFLAIVSTVAATLSVIEGDTNS